MNLFIRLFWVIFIARRQPQKNMDQVETLSFRVWLHDLGWRDHLPNYRVFSFMELGRYSIWHRSRLTQTPAYAMRMIAAQDFIYLRPITAFQKFEMSTELLDSDEKYFYFRHNFLIKGKLVAIGLVKEACVKKGAVVSPEIIFNQCQSQKDLITHQPSSISDPVVTQWLATHKIIKSQQ